VPEPAPIPRKLAIASALALFCFSVLSSVALAAWVSREVDPWDWHAIVTLLAAAGGLTTGALMWRAPSRTHAAVGIAVMVLSLVRIGIPTELSWRLLVWPLVTGLLMLPLVRAVTVPP
jgi:hypothetical protein